MSSNGTSVHSDVTPAKFISIVAIPTHPTSFSIKFLQIYSLLCTDVDLRDNPIGGYNLGAVQACHQMLEVFQT